VEDIQLGIDIAQHGAAEYRGRCDSGYSPHGDRPLLLYINNIP